MTFHLVLRVARWTVLLGALLAACVGAAGAAPLGQITEFPAPGTNPAQVVAGPDGNLWFSDRNGAVGQITTGGAVNRFTTGLNHGERRPVDRDGPGRQHVVQRPRHDQGGRGDQPDHARDQRVQPALNQHAARDRGRPGRERLVHRQRHPKAIGMINPTTHAINEFNTGLTPTATLQQGLVAGPDGNLWFTESAPGKIGMINPTTHAISEFSTGLNTGSAPGASIVVGPDGALWFMDGGTT